MRKGLFGFMIVLALVVMLTPMVASAGDVSPLLGKEGGIYGQAPGEGKFHSANGPVDFARGEAGISIVASGTYPPTPIAVAATTGNLGSQAMYDGVKGKPHAGFAYRNIAGENPYGSAAGAGYGRRGNDETP